MVQVLANRGYRVIVAGLDQDFRGLPFGQVPQLMAIAEHVTKLQAVCSVCGSPASRTQRLIDGEPAAFDDPIILVELQNRMNHVVVIVMQYLQTKISKTRCARRVFSK